MFDYFVFGCIEVILIVASLKTAQPEKQSQNQKSHQQQQKNSADSAISTTITTSLRSDQLSTINIAKKLARMKKNTIFIALHLILWWRQTCQKQFFKRMTLGGGLRGLRNLGNTCYMNSALQCLSNTRLLVKQMLMQEHGVNQESSLGAQGNIYIEFKEFIKNMWNHQESTKSYQPKKLKQFIGKFNTQFADYRQKDGLELLATVLDGLNQDVKFIKNQGRVSIDSSCDNLSDEQLSFLYNKKYLWNNNSFITRLFSGQYKTEIKCLKCMKQSENQSQLKQYQGFRVFDNFTIMYLPIYSHQTESEDNLDQCLKNFSERQILENENSWYCKFCDCDQPSEKVTQIYQTNKYVIIGLKRFENNRKINKNISFPMKLDMEPYTKGNICLMFVDKTKKKIYSLYAVINHYGSTMYSGHYTAFCKNFSSERWYEFDDETVRQIPGENIASKQAYALLYERIDD